MDRKARARYTMAMRPSPTAPLTLMVAALLLGGCVSPIASLNRTLTLWHGGERGAAIARSALEYERFRESNDLSEDMVRTWASALQRRLDEVPIVASRERLSPLPGEQISTGQGALDRGLRGDLLSHQASRVARAIESIGGLQLQQPATALIALIVEPAVIEPDGDVLATLDPAERTLTIKRMALDALERLR